MVFQHPVRRRATVVLGLVAMLAVFPGCPFAPSDDEGGGDDVRPPVRNSVQGAIDLYAFAWTYKLLPEYEALLHDEFEYFPYIDQNHNDFPWLPPGAVSWGRTEELGMASNMFDPNFVPSDPQQRAVDTIEMKIDVLNQDDTDEGIVVETHALATVMWDTENGARSDVRFRFLVVPDSDEPGLYQIREQVETIQ